MVDHAAKAFTALPAPPPPLFYFLFFIFVRATSGFLFGFFIFDNLGTFLTVKNSYLGGFWGGFQELMALTGVWFPETDAKTTEFKKTIIRWGLATFALMCGAADPDCSEEESTGNAVRRGLLTTEEAELVTKMGGNAVVPLLWMFDVYEKNLAPKPGAAFKVNKIEDKILAMRGGVGGVLTAISSFGLTPLPLVHLMSALVKMVRQACARPRPLPSPVCSLVLFRLPSPQRIDTKNPPPAATLPSLHQGGRLYRGHHLRRVVGQDAADSLLAPHGCLHPHHLPGRARRLSCTNLSLEGDWSGSNPLPLAAANTRAHVLVLHQGHRLSRAVFLLPPVPRNTPCLPYHSRSRSLALSSYTLRESPQGLLEFVIMIRNPFGTDWVDFPTLLYHQQIRDEMLQYVTCGELAVGLSSVKAIKGIK